MAGPARLLRPGHDPAAADRHRERDPRAGLRRAHAGEAAVAPQGREGVRHGVPLQRLADGQEHHPVRDLLVSTYWFFSVSV